MSNPIKRRAYQIGAGALGSLAVVTIGFPGSLNILDMVVSILVFSIPALYLLREASFLYDGGVDPVEMVLMMVMGGLLMMFTSVAVLSPLSLDTATNTLGVIVVSFVLFFVPAALIWIYETKHRKTVSLSPA